MTTKTMPMTFAAGSALAGFERNLAAALASGSATVWRQIEDFAPVATAKSTAANYAQHQAIAANPAKPAARPTHTMLHTVTTKDAGRGNKGSSPWRFPV
jgi:hypothetical protein